MAASELVYAGGQQKALLPGRRGSKQRAAAVLPQHALLLEASGSELEPLSPPGSMSTSNNAPQTIFGHPLVRDDWGLWVLVFPRGIEHGGTVDTEAVHEDPLNDARRIFIRDKHVCKERRLSAEIHKAFKGPVSEGEFQRVIRDHVKRLCAESGFTCRTFSSIDRDETFMVLDLDVCMPTILGDLALRYDTKLPYRASAYAHMDPPEPLKTRYMDPVPAFAEYELHNKDHLEDFREVDALRLMKTRLDHKMSLELLERLNVISGCFPIQSMEQEEELDTQWVWNWRLRERKQDVIREFFGEEIAFFFRWVEFYTVMLLPLALVTAVLFGASDAIPKLWGHINARTHLLGIVILFWAALFNKLFAYSTSRTRMRWGMNDYVPIHGDRAGYRIDLENTKRLAFQEFLVLVVHGLYMGCFIYAIYWLKTMDKEARERKEMHSIFVKRGATLTVCTMRAFVFVWSHIAPKLIWLENLKTVGEAEDSLALKLATMNIFVALWKFVFIAFIGNMLPFSCAETQEALVHQIWAGQIYTEDQHSHLIDKYIYERHGHQCLKGCFPLHPEQSHHKGRTSCDMELERDLKAYFLLDMVVSMMFLVVPIILVKLDVCREIQGAKKTHGGTPYSCLQLQGKRYLQARYEYKSYGGSYVEDFMQFATNFALIVCFGIIYPPVIILALFVNQVEYKLMAYRMVHITCRPEPRGSRGIGSWEQIFDKICQCAIITNAGVAVFQMYPGRTMDFQHQVASFLVLEHVLLVLYSAVQSLLPDKPVDVARIEDFNMAFKRTMENNPPMEVPDMRSLGYLDAELTI